MAGEFRILPSSRLAHASRACPLLEQQADREAWVTCCSRRFLPLARRLARDSDLAQDLLQESWTRVLEHVCAYRGSPPACAWVRAIVHNCALDLQRKHSPLPLEPGIDIEDPSLSPEAQIQQQQLLRLLREVIDSLPAAYREVCQLRYGQELSTAETAQRLGISTTSVSSRLSRAVRMLRKRLDARLEEQS